MLFEELVLGKRDRLQVLPEGVRLGTREGARGLKSWALGLEAAISEEALGHVYPWRRPEAQALLTEYEYATDVYLRLVVPFGFTYVSAKDGVWIVPVDDWTPVMLCAAQMAHDGPVPDGKEALDDAVVSICGGAWCRPAMDLCAYMAYRMPESIGMGAALLDVRRELYAQVSDTVRGTTAMQLGNDLEMLFRLHTADAVREEAQRRFADVALAAYGPLDRRAYVPLKRNTGMSALDNLQAGMQLRMVVPGNARLGGEVRVAYVVPDELAVGQVCACDLALRVERAAWGDEVPYSDAKFQYLVKVNDLRADGTLDVVVTAGSSARPFRACLRPVE